MPKSYAYIHEKTKLYTFFTTDFVHGVKMVVVYTAQSGK